MISSDELGSNKKFDPNRAEAKYHSRMKKVYDILAEKKLHESKGSALLEGLYHQLLDAKNVCFAIDIATEFCKIQKEKSETRRTSTDTISDAVTRGREVYHQKLTEAWKYVSEEKQPDEKKIQTICETGIDLSTEDKDSKQNFLTIALKNQKYTLINIYFEEKYIVQFSKDQLKEVAKELLKAKQNPLFKTILIYREDVLKSLETKTINEALQIEAEEKQTDFKFLHMLKKCRLEPESKATNQKSPIDSTIEYKNYAVMKFLIEHSINMIGKSLEKCFDFLFQEPENKITNIRFLKFLHDYPMDEMNKKNLIKNCLSKMIKNAISSTEVMQIMRELQKVDNIQYFYPGTRCIGLSKRWGMLMTQAKEKILTVCASEPYDKTVEDFLNIPLTVSERMFSPSRVYVLQYRLQTVPLHQQSYDHKRL